MRVLLLAILAGLLSPMLLVHPVRGSEGEGAALCAIAAVPVSEGVRGPYSEPTSAQAARLVAELPEALTRAGLPVLSARLADVKLADRPDLLNCRGDECLLAQARLLGVSRLILPHLSPLPAAPGVRIELRLLSVVKQTATPARTSQAQSLEKVAEASESCSPCRPEAIPDALSRVVTQLLKKRDLRLGAQVEVRAGPGASIRIDGALAGTGRVSLRLPAGAHTFSAESREGRSERTLTLVPGQGLVVDLAGLSEPDPAPLFSGHNAGRPRLRAAKWVMLTLGLGAMIAGTTLWALDGASSCDRVPGQLRCPLLLDTKTAGVAIFATGTAVLGISAVLFGVDARRGGESAPASTLLSMSGRF